LARWFFAGAVLVSLMAALSGCFAGTPSVDTLSKDEVVGVWVHHERGQEDAEITFNADGTASIDRLTAELREEFRTTEFLNGTWQIEARGDANQPSVVVVGENKAGDGVDTWANVRQERSGLVLFFTIGDPDEGRYYDFVRADE
jgi:hypothetical protein